MSSPHTNFNNVSCSSVALNLVNAVKYAPIVNGLKSNEFNVKKFSTSSIVDADIHLTTSSYSKSIV